MNPPYVRRNVNAPSTSSHYVDPRIQSNPQPIPQNQALAPLQRSGTSTARSFPGPGGYSPAQSPHQHHAPYMASPSLYGAGNLNPNEAVVSHAPIMPPVKSQTNGQFLWQRQRMSYNAQPQHNQPPTTYNTGTPPMTTKYSHQQLAGSTTQYHPSYQQSSMNMMPNSNPAQYVYMPNTSVRPPRFPPSAPSPALGAVHTPMQATNQPYYGQTGYYSSPMPHVRHFGAPAYDPSMVYPHDASQMLQTPTMLQQQQILPQPPPSSARRKVIIKDPNTLQDVTNELLKSGRSDSSSPSHQSFQPVASTEQSRIAANFAARVARVAKHPGEAGEEPTEGSVPKMETVHRPPLPPPPSAVSPGLIIPSNIDTSVPPPTLPILITPGSTSVATQSLSHTMQISSQQLKNAVDMPSTGTQLPSIGPSTIPPGVNMASTPRHAAPVAVVQPQKKVPDPIPIASVTPEVQTKPIDISIKTMFTAPSPLQETMMIAEEIQRETEKIKRGEVITDIVNNNVAITSEKSNESHEPSSQPSPVKAMESTDTTISETGHLQSSESPTDVKDIPISTADDIHGNLTEQSPTSGKEDLEPPEEQETQNTAPQASPDVTEPSTVTADHVIQLDDEKVDQPVSVDAEPDKNEVEFSDTVMNGDSAAQENSEKPPEEKVQPGVVSPSEDQKIAPIVEPIATNEDSETKQVLQSDLPEKATIERMTETIEIDPKPIVKDTEEVDEASDNQKKKVYDRSFLMQFRFHDMALEKPKDLPVIEDIIMDRPIPKSSISNSLPCVDMTYRGSDFTPTWMGGGGFRPGRQTSRGSRGGGPQRPQPPKIIKKVPSISLETDLKRAENAWVPSKLENKPAAALSTEEAQTEEVLKQVRAILNKLTPSKFSPLMQKFQQLPINSEIRLREVINLIFEKAIDEPNFSEAYANMCRTMSQFRVTAPAPGVQGSVPSGTVEFRKILLTRCQREFEKDRANENTLCNLRKKVEEAKTPAEKQQLQEELENAETKERRRMLGNIRFIGELFKLQMLTESIMHNCIMSLFRGRDEESLECLCRLLTTIGKILDHQKGKQRMLQYFQQIEKIIREKKTSARVRFMLKDVIDLRKNNWVPRAIKAQGPKTIDQIHADAKEEKEQLALQVAAAAVAPPSMKTQSRGNRMGSRGNTGLNVDDGWTKVGLQQKSIRYDPQKMKLSKAQFDESTVTLGPNRGGKPVWKSGSGSNTTKTGSGGYSYRDNFDSVAPRSSTPTTMNRFSALGATGGPDIYSQRGPGRVSSLERNKSDSRGSSGSGGSRSGVRDERQSALETARRLTSIERKRPQVADISTPAKPAAAAFEARENVDEEALTKKIESTIKEYMHLVDIKEATECFEDLKIPPSYTYLIVKSCLELSLERSSNDRNNISQLLSSFVSNEKVSRDQYLKGVISNMELAIDVELDLPKVWSCLAEQIAPIFCNSSGKIRLESLKEMAEPLFESDKAAAFVAEILKKLTTQMNIEAVVQYWKESNLDIEYFLQSNNAAEIEEFLQRHDLEAFYERAPPLVTRMSPAEVDFNGYVTDITKQLDMKKSDNDIFDWVETNVSAEKRSRPTFVRALTRAVCNMAIKQGDKGQLEVDKKFIKKCSVLLKKFIDIEAKELQAVYALQKLFIDLDQPANILKLLFDALYDEDVISEQTFFKWEETEDPNECEGRGVALLSVNPFFTWLRQADVESDE